MSTETLGYWAYCRVPRYGGFKLAFQWENNPTILRQSVEVRSKSHLSGAFLVRSARYLLPVLIILLMPEVVCGHSYPSIDRTGVKGSTTPVTSALHTPLKMVAAVHTSTNYPTVLFRRVSAVEVQSALVNKAVIPGLKPRAEQASFILISQDPVPMVVEQASVVAVSQGLPRTAQQTSIELIPPGSVTRVERPGAVGIGWGFSTTIEEGHSVVESATLAPIIGQAPVPSGATSKAHLMGVPGTTLKTELAMIRWPNSTGDFPSVPTTAPSVALRSSPLSSSQTCGQCTLYFHVTIF